MSSRAFAVALTLLLAPAALASGKGHKKRKKPGPTPAQVAHPFADIPVAKLQVVDTRSQRAVIENKAGEIVLVRAGDLLAAESFEVVKVTRGCVQLRGPDLSFSMCADVPEVPRT